MRHVRYVVEVLRKVLTAACSPLTHGVWQAHDVQPLAATAGCSRGVRTASGFKASIRRRVQSAAIAGWSCRMAVSEDTGDYVASLKNANLENAEGDMHMIVRIWRATATRDGLPAYRKHFEDNVLPELRGLAGFREAYLLTREHDSTIDVEVHTLRDSLEAIRAFAGPDIEHAVVEPQAQAALAGYETMVVHYDAVTYPGRGD